MNASGHSPVAIVHDDVYTHGPMGRHRREDQENVARVVFAMRLSPNEKMVLDQLVDLQNKNLAKLGLAPVITPGSMVRSLILHRAGEEGLIEKNPDAPIDDKEFVVVPPRKRPSREGPPLPPPTRFERVLNDDAGSPKKKAGSKRPKGRRSR